MYSSRQVVLVPLDGVKSPHYSWNTILVSDRNHKNMGILESGDEIVDTLSLEFRW